MSRNIEQSKPGVLKAFFSALRFLTVAPVPLSWCGNMANLAGSVTWFPVVGLVVGVAVAVFDQLFMALFPPLLASVMTVMALAVISGGLHLDGLADTADGFYGSKPSETVLSIMKDSRTGAMGVLAVVAVFFLKGAALASMGSPRMTGLILAPVLARTTPVLMMAGLDYVRDQGLGSLFNDRGKGGRAFFAVILMGVLAVVLCGWEGVWALAAVGVAVLLFGTWCKKKIGGYTGDTLGAMIEIAEALVLVVLAAA